MHNERCDICNKVSSREIETNPGDFSKNPFVPDPGRDFGFICVECKEHVEELSLEFLLGDDPYGWDQAPEPANDNDDDYYS